MKYTTREDLQEQYPFYSTSGDAQREEVAKEIASDPNAPWWALWEVVVWVRVRFRVELANEVFRRILDNPALPLLLLEEPVWVRGIINRCHGWFEKQQY